MKSKFLWMAVAAVLTLLSAPAFAQGDFTSIQGKITDEKGPLVGATVEYSNKETGRTYKLTTDKRGEYYSIGVLAGAYRVVITKDGQVLWTHDNVMVKLTTESTPNVRDFDLQKLRAAAMNEPGKTGATAEQIAKIEETKKENAKIQTLNQRMAAAQVAEDAKDWDQAIAIMTDATTVDPTKHELWGKLCEVNLGGRKLEDAMVSCQKALAIAEPQPGVNKVMLAQYHNNLASAYAKLGKSEDAVSQYTLAAETDPTGAARYYFNLGAILTNESARQQDQTTRFRMIDQATEAFDKAIAADPAYAEAYYQKAVNLLGKATLDKTNKMIAPPGTAEAFNKYLELEPTGRHVDEVKGMLAYIGAEVQTSFKKGKK